MIHSNGAIDIYSVNMIRYSDGTVALTIDVDFWEDTKNIFSSPLHNFYARKYISIIEFQKLIPFARKIRVKGNTTYYKFSKPDKTTIIGN